MRKFPVARQMSWQSIISQFILLAVFMVITDYIGGFSSLGLLIGVLIYALYYLLVKFTLEHNINDGLKLINKGEFNQAISKFEAAYEFFSRHPWLDRWRFLFLHTSTLNYREMALINIAVCFSQTGDGKRSKQYYQRALAEFPDSMLAQVALKAIESFESNQDPSS